MVVSESGTCLVSLIISDDDDDIAEKETTFLSLLKSLLNSVSRPQQTNEEKEGFSIENRLTQQENGLNVTKSGGEDKKN